MFDGEPSSTHSDIILRIPTIILHTGYIELALSLPSFSLVYLFRQGASLNYLPDSGLHSAEESMLFEVLGFTLVEFVYLVYMELNLSLGVSYLVSSILVVG